MDGAAGRGQKEDREEKDEGDDGEGHTGDGAYGEVEPEYFAGTVGEERQQSKDCGEDSEHYRPHLKIPRPDISVQGALRRYGGGDGSVGTGD